MITVVVLAAGKGSRMRSSLPKALHPLCGKPMIRHVLTNCQQVVDETVVVLGYGEQLVRRAITDFDIRFALQNEQLGTGHAVLCAESYIRGDQILVLNGDCPLVPVELLRELIVRHSTSTAVATMVAADVKDPTGYGRVITDKNERVEAIIEHDDANESERQNKLVNAGIYMFERAMLFEHLRQIKSTNAQGEFYLTDVVRLLVDNKHEVQLLTTSDFHSITGVNTQGDLARAEQIMTARLR